MLKELICLLLLLGAPVANRFRIDLVLVAQVVTNISLLTHVHVKQGKLVLFHRSQFLLVCALQLLFDHDELVSFVQVVESTSCLNLLLILGLSAQDELPELLFVIAILDILQGARVHCAHKVLVIGRRLWHSDCVRPC